jgi:hypothetical protein
VASLPYTNIPPDIPIKEKTYDDLIKEALETFSPKIVIAFLNSVFKHDMPPDSAVEPSGTESNKEKRTVADYTLKVTEPDGTVRYFHIEAQTSNDKRMALRMFEYGVRFALGHIGESREDSVLIEFPSAAVIYLKDNSNTPRTLNVTIKIPGGQTLEYAIPTERMSDYTPEQLLEQDKVPLFPFYMANFQKGKDPDKFEREWLAGCKKLYEFVEAGRIEKSDAEKLMDSGAVVVRKAKHPREEEVLRKMTMFDTVGVGVDWIELKRRENVRIAEAEQKKAIAAAKKALAKGLSPEDVADFLDLPLDEVKALADS